MHLIMRIFAIAIFWKSAGSRFHTTCIVSSIIGKYDDSDPFKVHVVDVDWFAQDCMIVLM